MHFKRPSISIHRLQRLHRWAMLWLTWFAAFLETAASLAPLSREAEHVAHLWLDRIAWLIVSIVMIRAAPRVRGVNPRQVASPHRRVETSLSRAIVGTRAWRELHSKHLLQRIAALRQNIDVLVARVLRRIPCGLTRRRPILPRPEARRADAHYALVAPVPCADTS